MSQIPSLANRNTLCIIMGGGRGKRMEPLTRYRSKPAVPLGGNYRLIDIPISNCLNSGFNKILVLTQYNSESLNKHIFRTYKLDTFFGGFVEILAAEQSYEKTEWFQGTADSVRRAMPHIRDPRIDEVIVLSGDQLYNMDLRELQHEHHRRGADLTVACHLEPEENIHGFGIMNTDADSRITSFVEKPKDASLVTGGPVLLDGKPRFLANMGIYIFKKDVLTELLSQNPNQIDFGKEIIPAAIRDRKVYAYNFTDYWSDIGTIGSYYEASLMLTDYTPAFNLYNEDWQIFTRPRYLPPAKILECQIHQSIISEGCIIEESVIRRSLVGVRSVIGNNTRIFESIVTGNDYFESQESRSAKHDRGIPHLGIGRDCEIRKAIIDKNVAIGDGCKIINKNNADHEDGDKYSIRDGIVVVHKDAVIPSGTVI
ncbi:MAG: glucose-1-phosphate adenylyltransferase [Candidatus Omnitrophica bacterium]|jgi:glucose-1-phosphate adenylyltransferase|nr:glucose-1-phosphate adenylyltransferase [Candidatus Omnitrophota bacterium]